MNMPLALLNRRRRGAVAFSPTALFALAEPGVWYDPSDLTTLFQDTAGTTPVTTPGQSVALALDKSKGLVLGSELVTNGDFSQGATGFTQTSGNVGTSSVIAGELNVVAGGGGSGGFYQDITVVQGATYLLTVKGRRIAGSGSVRFQAYDGAAFTTLIRQFFDITTTGPQAAYSAYVRATSTTTIRVYLYADTSTTGGFDNVSIKELPGFHATQATAGSRPIYGIVPVGGRRNLLTFTEQFDNAAWVKTRSSVTANAGVAPDGTTTADKMVESTDVGDHFIQRAAVTVSTATTYTLSYYAKAAERTVLAIYVAGVTATGVTSFNLSNGTIIATSNNTVSNIASVGSGWYRCSVTVTTNSTSFSPYIYPNTGGTSYAGDGTSGILIWGAQLEAGSTASAYQKVTTQYDVTEAGVSSLSYLAFDGVDDSLVTPTITPGIDKVQTFAGVRKLSDAAAGMLIELSANTGANNGSFYLSAPENNTASARYGFLGRGSQIPANGQRSLVDTGAAPDQAVLTGQGDISADNNLIRRNGVAFPAGTLDQGTGNFGNYPMYIGRRGGTTVPFNGNIFSLIVRFGANLTADQITSTETWVNGKTRAY